MKWLHRILLFGGLGFLAYLVWETGPGELWRQLAALGWGLVPLLASEGLGLLAHTIGWRYCTDGSARSVSLPRLFRMALAGFAINYLTPTASVGGEISRASLLASVQPAPAAVTSVLADKLMSAFAHLALAAVGAILLFWGFKLPGELLLAMVLSTALLIGGMLGFLLLQKYGKLAVIFCWLARNRLGGRWLQSAAARMSEVDQTLKEFYRKHPWSLVRSFGWHMLGHSMVILQAWLFLRILKQPAALPIVAAAGFLSLWFDLLTFAIPLNLGSLEGSRIIIFRALGCPALLGMAFGIAVRLAQGFWACIGLLCYAQCAAHKRQAKSGSPPGALTMVAEHQRELQRKFQRQQANDA